MRREITWVEKLPDRVKREVRVYFHGGKIYWQDRRSVGRRQVDEEWNEAMVPSEEDWDRLHEKVMRRFQRHTAGKKELDLVLKRTVGVKHGEPSQRLGKEL